MSRFLKLYKKTKTGDIESLLYVFLSIIIALTIEKQTGLNSGLPITTIADFMQRNYQNNLKSKEIKNTKRSIKSKKISNLHPVYIIAKRNLIEYFQNRCSKNCSIYWINLEGLGYYERKDDIFFENFLKNISGFKNIEIKHFKNLLSGLNTIDSELSYLCGGSTYSKFKKDKCLPDIFKANYWETNYYHSNDLSFYRRKYKLGNIGFSKLISSKENIRNFPKLLNLCLKRQFCAPEDKIIFETLTNENIKNKYSFNFFTTIDTHGPHSKDSYLDKKIVSSSLKLKINKLQEDIKKLLISKSSQNTIMVITADHQSLKAKKDYPSKTDLIIIKFKNEN